MFRSQEDIDKQYVTHGIGEYVKTLFPDEFTGVCIDIGAYHPFWTSNSWIFEQAGWETWCIEPNPRCIPELKRWRDHVIECACGNENKGNVDFYIYTIKYAGPPVNEVEWYGEAAASGLINQPNTDAIKKEILKVSVRTLDTLLADVIKKENVDYVTIDVEQNEMAVLQGFDLSRYRPKVISLENYGCSEEQNNYLKTRNYRKVFRISVDDIYISEEYYPEASKLHV